MGITQDKTMAVEISEQQFCICRDANGHFCSINAPLQPLATHLPVSQLYMPRIWQALT